MSSDHTILILLTVAVFSSGQLRTETTSELFHAAGHGTAPTRVHELGVSNCTFKNVKGFLKEECIIENHRYFKCSRSDRYYKIVAKQCKDVSFTKICPNDDAFYQACGLTRCIRSMTSEVDFGIERAVCGQLICRTKNPNIPLSQQHSSDFPDSFFTGNREFWRTVRCNQEPNCLNTIDGVSVDEYGCDYTTKASANYTCLLRFMDFTWNLYTDKVCDNVCDCTDCDDEALCNNMTVGLFCVNRIWRKKGYIKPYKICDHKADCVSGIDEKLCKQYNETCESNSLAYSSATQAIKFRRVLTPRSKCSILEINKIRIICSDYRDQMNCTFSTISPLLCNVDNYPTTLSDHVICKTQEIRARLCDDGIEKECVNAEFECKIHKHRLCDNVKDCLHGRDEDDLFCEDMIEINCVRRWSYTKQISKIPRQWVLDGVSDCVNNIDEAPDEWMKECGFGLRTYYSSAKNHTSFNSHCSSSQLKCPYRPEMMDMNGICLGEKQNCDSQICKAARKDYEIISSVPYKVAGGNTKRLFHCLLGLHDLENKIGNCSSTRLTYQKKLAGVDDIHVILSEHYAKYHTDCRNLFGELYVYVACTDLCGNYSTCPLKPLTVSGKTKKCFNYPKDKLVISLAEDNKLGLAIQQSSSHISKAAFACDDGQCTSFDEVCNLEVNCKDESDEKYCSNNFKCSLSGEYIPSSSKCNGKFDCYDFSDECNSDCNNQIVMFDHIAYLIVALVFGIIATSLNSINFINGFREYPSLKTETARVNKCFVLLITFGDLLQGIFLIMLSLGDKFFNKSDCSSQFEWTTSSLCKILGVISTIGSLLSLYSMTVLSVIRAKKIRSMLTPKDEMSTKTKLSLASTVCAIIILSTLVAILPLLIAQDYFVQKLNYHKNRLFVGAPNKQKHMKIIYAYYGRVLHEGESDAIMSWAAIRNLVKDMFANDVVTGINLGFYGSNGFCLFSYFVREDVLYKFYSITILSTNFICVLLIGGCYLYVNVLAKKTTGAVKSNEASAKAGRKLQRKITLIVTTDVLTWLPFIIVCIVNYTELLDTSSWYFIFCIFFLPINSIINPIGIYDDTIIHWCGIGQAVKGIKSKFHSLTAEVRKKCSKFKIRGIPAEITENVRSSIALDSDESPQSICQSSPPVATATM